jgi:trk system potassium uptake protein
LIRYRTVAFLLGQFLLALAGTMMVPIAWGVLRGVGGVRGLLVAAAATAAVGGLLLATYRAPQRDLNQREALLLVVVTWIAVSAFGALPFYFSPHFRGYTDAFFESVSGFTTTGASILARPEDLPEAVQFWRCFTHWLGGMGIVLLGIAILPLIGHGGMQLYRAEFSGARSEKLTPRIAETVLALWRIYLVLSVLMFVALMLAGMGAFESLCHTFGALGTGGFSTRAAGVGEFNSPAIEWILVVFMLLGGMSFIQLYRLTLQREVRAFWRDYELRAYLLVATAATAVIAIVLGVGAGYDTSRAIRAAAFQVVSIMTTTGFASEDFEAWHPLPQVILLALMFVGGCTGSTAGGLKVARLVLLGRVVNREFHRMVERRGVFAVRLGGQVIAEETVQSLLNLVYLAFVVNFAACLLLAAMGVDVLTAISGVAATMFNVGPGLGSVGPMDNYGHLPFPAKWVLSGCMIAGRLEFYTVLVILTPVFWRK